ncbi:MAG: 50S ribosome-binding protein YggL [Neptuniibacter sp.]
MTSTSKRKRRLRKKLFTDEFAVFTFELRINLSTSNPEDELTFLDTLIDKLESMELCYMGHFLGERLRGHVIAKGRYSSPTEAQRCEFSEWCSKQRDITEYSVGGLVDGNQI